MTFGTGTFLLPLRIGCSTKTREQLLPLHRAFVDVLHLLLLLQLLSDFSTISMSCSFLCIYHLCVVAVISCFLLGSSSIRFQTLCSSRACHLDQVVLHLVTGASGVSCLVRWLVRAEMVWIIGQLALDHLDVI